MSTSSCSRSFYFQRLIPFLSVPVSEDVSSSSSSSSSSSPFPVPQLYKSKRGFMDTVSLGDDPSYAHCIMEALHAALRGSSSR